jgi:predicted RNA-binding protein associated with RNAse of E/G family
MGEVWPELTPGTALTIVKLDPDGHEVARYPGVVIDAGAHSPWVAVQATWVSREHDLDGLRFIAGDVLHEFFSPNYRFNVLAVFSPDGQLRGWYANVTYPARLNATTDPKTLFWHDLYIDVVALPGGRIVVRDEDELEESGLRETDRELYEAIRSTRDEILALARRRAFPFHEADIVSATPNLS